MSWWFVCFWLLIVKICSSHFIWYFSKMWRKDENRTLILNWFRQSVWMSQWAASQWLCDLTWWCLVFTTVMAWSLSSCMEFTKWPHTDHKRCFDNNIPHHNERPGSDTAPKLIHFCCLMNIDPGVRDTYIYLFYILLCNIDWDKGWIQDRSYLRVRGWNRIHISSSFKSFHIVYFKSLQGVFWFSSCDLLTCLAILEMNRGKWFMNVTLCLALSYWITA